MVPQWELLQVVSTDSEAALIRGFLTSRGVTVENDSRLFTQEPVTSGALGDVRIMVPADQLDAAQRLLDEVDVEAEQADGDAPEAVTLEASVLDLLGEDSD